MQRILTPSKTCCVETTAKREYTRVMEELLAMTGEDKELEQELQLLLTFLETANFRELRSQCDALFTQGKAVECLLQSSDQGRTCSFAIRSAEF